MTSQDIIFKFNKLYNDTYDDISKYVVCKCLNINDVSDIIQNIYTDVYRALLNKKNVNNLYIMGICKNKINDYYRFNYKDKIISLFTTKDDITLIDNIPINYNLEETISIKYDIEMVWKYLRKKNVIISKIFYLYYKMGLTIKEISKELDISESNVKHYLYRTLNELNTYFKKGDK